MNRAGLGYRLPVRLNLRPVALFGSFRARLELVQIGLQTETNKIDYKKVNQGLRQQ